MGRKGKKSCSSMEVEAAAATKSRKRKRKDDDGRPKLLVGDKVEVRSVEDGFLGSWHSGTVVGVESQLRKVQYDHLLCDDGSGKLVDPISVSCIVDGKVPAGTSPSENRGNIRPLPPLVEFDKWFLHYGQCVDVLHQDAWWEGVIFDHEDGSEERLIFFPDMGDDMLAHVDMLRITQDWNEAREEWKPRGNWMFLELIEEVEQEWPLLVSLKQIWYEVRLKKGFRNIKDWTYSVRDIWKELILCVVLDNLKLTAKEFFRTLNSECLTYRPEEATVDTVKLKSDSYYHSTVAIVPSDTSKTDMEVIEDENDDCSDEAPPGFSIPPSNPNVLLRISCHNKNGAVLMTNSEVPRCGEPERHKERKKSCWLPAGADLVPQPVSDPDTVSEYSMLVQSGKQSPALQSRVRQHLLSIGWKIEFKRTEELRAKSKVRFRYTAPNGEFYYSLSKICEALSNQSPETLTMVSNDGQRSLDVVPGYISSGIRKHELLESAACEFVVVERECSPESVLDYYTIVSNGKTNFHKVKIDAKLKELRIKARKHLSFAGWSFFYPQSNRGLYYRSPEGRPYDSLSRACRAYVDSMKEKNRQLAVEGLHSPLTRSSTTLPGVRKFRIKKKNGVLLCDASDYSPSPESGALTKSVDYDGSVGRSAPPVLRSTKRARQVVNPSSSLHSSPRTVLAWLIEKNALLPRAKVQYRNRKDGHIMAEGRVTRDGIKCGCCQNIFSLINFEAHAGSTYHRPSANIFLEDGRSLLDCQLQLKGCRGSRAEPPRRVKKGNRRQSGNDYICSICHYGGELVLCDKCPSSFHTHCLGLTEVPDGDWFCPSCCCGICSQNRYVNNSELHADSSFLNCEQCERKYHVACLKEKSDAMVENHHGGFWFCNTRCKEIFLGLQRLLGNPIPLGFDNLTWTLLKYTKHDSFVHDTCDIEKSVENYSKLNVALSVMHECFEPVKEPRTRRDLVEDIIFCRSSELKRLDFRGFYTVLLEKDDELITVATLRVYGEKVAELPLVGTRFQYRRLGMCRILMNELEKKLLELGVERLVLPAVQTVLNTWITAFGFSVMMKSERLNFLDYTFLDFQGTVMCQKLLPKVPSKESSPLERTQLKCSDDIHGSSNVEIENNSPVSEVFQAEKIEESGIVDQGRSPEARVCGSNGGSGTPLLLNVVNQQPQIECSSESSMEVSAQKKVEKAKSPALLKCYKRRRLLAACGEMMSVSNSRLSQVNNVKLISN